MSAPNPEGLRLQVDMIKCVGHASCFELLPERVKLDEWGYPIIETDPLPSDLVGHARRAVAACPTLALRVDGKVARQR
jgi:ferredoxin